MNPHTWLSFSVRLLHAWLAEVNVDLKPSKLVSAWETRWLLNLLYLGFWWFYFKCPALAAKQVILCKYHLYHVEPSTVVLLFMWREAQNVSNKKKKYDGLTPSTLYFILVTFLTFDNLYGQGQRDYLGNERLIKHFG